MASRPQARTWPIPSYTRHVGILKKEALDPGQARIWWISPELEVVYDTAEYVVPKSIETETLWG